MDFPKACTDILFDKHMSWLDCGDLRPFFQGHRRTKICKTITKNQKTREIIHIDIPFVELQELIMFWWRWAHYQGQKLANVKFP